MLYKCNTYYTQEIKNANTCTPSNIKKEKQRN